MSVASSNESDQKALLRPIFSGVGLLHHCKDSESTIICAVKEARVLVLLTQLLKDSFMHEKNVAWEFHAWKFHFHGWKWNFHARKWYFHAWKWRCCPKFFMGKNSMYEAVYSYNPWKFLGRKKYAGAKLIFNMQCMDLSFNAWIFHATIFSCMKRIVQAPFFIVYRLIVWYISSYVPLVAILSCVYMYNVHIKCRKKHHHPPGGL